MRILTDNLDKRYNTHVLQPYNSYYDVCSKDPSISGRLLSTLSEDQLTSQGSQRENAVYQQETSANDVWRIAREYNADYRWWVQGSSKTSYVRSE